MRQWHLMGWDELANPYIYRGKAIANQNGFKIYFSSRIIKSKYSITISNLVFCVEDHLNGVFNESVEKQG